MPANAVDPQCSPTEPSNTLDIGQLGIRIEFPNASTIGDIEAAFAKLQIRSAAVTAKRLAVFFAVQNGVPGP